MSKLDKGSNLVILDCSHIVMMMMPGTVYLVQTCFVICISGGKFDDARYSSGVPGTQSLLVQTWSHFTASQSSCGTFPLLKKDFW